MSQLNLRIRIAMMGVFVFKSQISSGLLPQYPNSKGLHADARHSVPLKKEIAHLRLIRYLIFVTGNLSLREKTGERFVSFWEDVDYIG